AQFFNPRWAPDGIRVAYATDQNASSGRDIYVGRTNFDHAPVIDSIAGQAISDTMPVVDVTIGQDSTLTLSYHRSDSDGTAIVDSAYFLRPDLGMSFNASTHTLTWA